ncbi:hypothetical protein TrST_g10034 [Triparma strigata]|uniref:Protein kinase domain-containing protein n=1 Tax=Triparma strigata TaxID=1606541 RepID=A0A9W7B2Y8_9STRA|nr:hypothetical protein TrST_g10034 [Triparma strigata]
MDSQIPSNLSSNISSNLSSSVRESPKRKRGPAATTSSGNKSRTSPGRLFSNNNPRPNIRELNREDEEGNNEGNSEQINMDEVIKNYSPWIKTRPSGAQDNNFFNHTFPESLPRVNELSEAQASSLSPNKQDFNNRTSDLNRSSEDESTSTSTSTTTTATTSTSTTTNTTHSSTFEIIGTSTTPSACPPTPQRTPHPHPSPMKPSPQKLLPKHAPSFPSLSVSIPKSSPAPVPSEQLPFISLFTTLSLLGSGTFADVHKVRDSNNNLWAVKRNRRPFRNSADKHHQTREVRTMLHLQEKNGPSPYLLSYHRSWTESSHFYVQTELCSSHTLSHYLKTLTCPPPLAHKILHDVSQGLKSIHSSGLVHMDIKPGNLLLSLTGNVKIGDFGLTCSPNSRAESDEGDSTYLSLEGLAGGVEGWGAF